MDMRGSSETLHLDCQAKESITSKPPKSPVTLDPVNSVECDFSFIKPPENDNIVSNGDSLEDCFWGLDSMPLADFCASCNCGVEVAQLKTFFQDAKLISTVVKNGKEKIGLNIISLEQLWLNRDPGLSRTFTMYFMAGGG